MRVSKRIVFVVTIIIISVLIATWFIIATNAEYEVKLVKGEEYTLRIGFETYRFLLKGLSRFRMGEQELSLTVTQRNDTETRTVGYPSSAIGKTFRFLDLEVFIKGELVDGLRVIVKKW